MGNKAERIARKEKFFAELDAQYTDDWYEQLPKRKIIVMGQELEIWDREFEALESQAENYGFSDAGAYLTNVLGHKWNTQDSFTLAEVLFTEARVLANE